MGVRRFATDLERTFGLSAAATRPQVSWLVRRRLYRGIPERAERQRQGRPLVSAIAARTTGLASIASTGAQR